MLFLEFLPLCEPEAESEFCRNDKSCLSAASYLAFRSKTALRVGSESNRGCLFFCLLFFGQAKKSKSPSAKSDFNTLMKEKRAPRFKKLFQIVVLFLFPLLESHKIGRIFSSLSPKNQRLNIRKVLNIFNFSLS